MLRQITQAAALLARVTLVLLLLFELLVVYPVGSMLSGALGGADDASGPILLISPLCDVAALVVLWRFGGRVSAWLLAATAVTGPLWSSILLGPASNRNLWPFWAQAAVVASWPLWGWLPFRQAKVPVADVFD